MVGTTVSSGGEALAPSPIIQRSHMHSRWCLSRLRTRTLKIARLKRLCAARAPAPRGARRRTQSQPRLSSPAPPNSLPRNAAYIFQRTRCLWLRPRIKKNASCFWFFSFRMGSSIILGCAEVLRYLRVLRRRGVGGGSCISQKFASLCIPKRAYDYRTSIR